MSEEQAKEVLDKIMGQLFGYQNPFTLEEFINKYAFDVRLPQKVQDSHTGEDTWAQSINPTKFIKMSNARDWSPTRGDGDWMQPKKDLRNIEEMLEAWNTVNYIATEREIETINIGQSDNIYNSENVFRSMDVHKSKNILFSDSCLTSEYCAVVSRSHNNSYSIRIEDSKDTDQSFNVSWSGKITKSMFIHDCYDLFECIFCSHITSKQYCIANMQFTEEEYFAIKGEIIKWILQP